MSDDPQVILIGNYKPDKQESMLRFASMLQQNLNELEVKCQLWHPPVVFNFLFKNTRLSKWLGYIDKYLLFPFLLRLKLKSLKNKNACIHVCDHSNAPYLKHIKGFRKVLTCHDLLAVRSALGLIAEHQTKGRGVRLQNWIYQSIKKADFILCDSKKTQEDLLAITNFKRHKTSTAYIGFNYKYEKLSSSRTAEILKKSSFNLPKMPFLLHVGSDAWYKNRIGVIYLLKAINDLAPKVYPLVCVGPPPSQEMREAISSLGLEHLVIFIQGTSNEELNAIYCSANLLIFPSLYEGFGWPIIEALASQCKVLTTNEAPMTEVGGTLANYISKPRRGTPKALTSWAAENAQGTLDAIAAKSPSAEDTKIHLSLFDNQSMAKAYAKSYS